MHELVRCFRCLARPIFQDVLELSQTVPPLLNSMTDLIADGFQVVSDIFSCSWSIHTHSFRTLPSQRNVFP